MDTYEPRELPPLQRYAREAVALVKARRQNDREAVRRIEAYHPRFHGISAEVARAGHHHGNGNGNGNGNGHRHGNGNGIGATVRGATFSVADARLVVAREQGFENWRGFARYLEAVVVADTPIGRFERAIETVISGDLVALGAALHRDPALVRARSARAHHGALLHYIAGFGVEARRQHVPANVGDVARMLLKAGAEPDAPVRMADVVWTPLTLTVSSMPVARAGVMGAVVEVLADFGAAIDGIPGGLSPFMLALAHRHQDAVRALARLGVTVDNIIVAAALGLVEDVARYVREGRTAADAVCPVPGPGLPPEPGTALDRAFLQACAFGRANVVRYMLEEAGVDAAVRDARGCTGLHEAAHFGHLDTVKLLVAHRAPLEATNAYGGTVLGYVAWASVNSGLPLDYVPIVEALLEAGARLDGVGYPSRNARVAEVLLRHGMTP